MTKYNFIQVEEELIENIMYLKSVPVLHYRIEYPVLKSKRFKNSLRGINRCIEEKACRYNHHCEQVLYKMAVDQFDFSISNNLPFHEYQAFMNYKITYCENCHFSAYFDQYEYTGGAHGNTMRTSCTWNLQTGKSLRLLDIPHRPCFLQNIKKEIKLQIKNEIENENAQYFRNYEELVEKAFNPNNFYLTPGCLVIYYQHYDIAPYSRGIPEFKIPYETVGARTPRCRIRC